MSMQDLHSILDQAKQDVASDRLRDAIGKLEAIQIHGSDLLAIVSRLTNLEASMQQGMVTTEQSFVERAKIARQIVGTISRMEARLFGSDLIADSMQEWTSNPFIYGPSVPPDKFVGRRNIIRAIKNRIDGEVSQSVSLIGSRRIGKSSLLRYIALDKNISFKQNYTYIVIYIDLTRATGHTCKGIMRLLRRQIGARWREPWSAASDGDLEEFDFALEDMHEAGIRLVLCLDEVDNLTKRRDEFDDLLEDWRANGQAGMMSMVTASQQNLADLSEAGGLTSPFYNIFSTYRLELFTHEEWMELFERQMPLTNEEEKLIESVTGGHPFFVQMAASYLWEMRSDKTIDSETFIDKLSAEMEPHLRNLWNELGSSEQVFLRSLVSEGARREPDVLENRLKAKGIIVGRWPFSSIFADLIRTQYS